LFCIAVQIAILLLALTLGVKMTIYETIIAAYPELANDKQIFIRGIVIQDDSDGAGAYLAKWDYDKPIPKGLKLGKANQPTPTAAEE